MLKFVCKEKEKTMSVGVDQLLDWSKVGFQDDESDRFPVKKITIEVEAGDIAVVVVERYLDTKYKNGCSVSTVDEEGRLELITFKERYALCDFDAEISVVRANKAPKEN